MTFAGSRPYPFAEVRRCTKTINALERPFTASSVPLTFLLANFTVLTPNAVTLLGGAFGVLGAGLFVAGWWAAAGIAYGIFFILDCSDGALARLKGKSSLAGARLDLAADRLVLGLSGLSRACLHVLHGNVWLATLCVAYLLSQGLTDLRAYRFAQKKLAAPPVAHTLVHRLQREAAQRRSARVADRGGWRLLFSRFAQIERQIRPTAWVCNIAFLAGVCFFPGAEAPIVAGCLAGLWYPPVLASARKWLMPVVMANP